MINLILLLTMSQSLAQIQIPQYASGYIGIPAPIGGASLTNQVTNTITNTFSITFSEIPQIFLSTNSMHQYGSILCFSGTITSKTMTQFIIDLTFCGSRVVYGFTLTYLAVNDPYVYIYDQIVTSTSSITDQLITFGNHDWVQAPSYSIAIIGYLFQNTQTTYYNLITVSSVSITSATITITENNLSGLYYPIQYNVIFTCPEFLNPASQAYDWNSGFINLINLSIN